MRFFFMVALFAAAGIAPSHGGIIEDAEDLYFAGRIEESIAMYQLAAQQFAQSDAESTGKAHNNACSLLTDLGEHRRALSDCEQAVRIRRLLDEPLLLAKSLNNTGLALQNLGRFEDAESAFLEALELSRTTEDLESEAINLSNLGSLAGQRGQYSHGLAYLRQSRLLADQHAAEPWSSERRIVAVINEGVILEKLGAFRPALSLYLGSLANEETMDRGHRANFQVNLGVIYRNLGDPVRAIEAFLEAKSTFEELGYKSALSNVLLNIGLVRSLNLADPVGAEASFREALAVAQDRGDKVEEIQDLFYLGQLLLSQGRLEEARPVFDQCLLAAKESGSAEGTWSALEGLGNVERSAGNLQQADAYLEQALAAIELVREELTGSSFRAGFFGDKRTTFSAAVRVLADLHKRSPDAGHAERALEIVQRAKVRDLLDALGPGQQQAEPLSASRLREEAGDELLLEYFVAGDRLFYWTIKSGAVALIDAGPSAPLMAASSRVHMVLSDGGIPDVGDLRLLSEQLLGDAALETYDRRALRVAPDGPLHYLPFELLPLPNQAGGEADSLLIDKYEVAYLPSSSALAWLRQRAPVTSDKNICFGNPSLPEVGEAKAGDQPSLRELLVERFQLAPLPASLKELEAIAKWLPGPHEFWTGAEASEENFRTATSGGAWIVHVAAHTVIDERGDDGAAILLAPTLNNDGLLYASELAKLRYRANLTVLAGCQTARGAEQEGRSLKSLTGAVLSSGSSAVLATLWDTGDAESAAFMDQYYFQLGRGATPRAALRKVKQRLRDSPEWNQPYIWSAYVLIGEPEDSPFGIPSSLKAFLAVVLLVAGVMLAALLIRRFR